MEPIKNSIIKETIRRKYELEATQQEEAIKNRINTVKREADVKTRAASSTPRYGILKYVVCCFVLTIAYAYLQNDADKMGTGFKISIVVCIIWAIVDWSGRENNVEKIKKDTETSVRQMEENIRNLYTEADNKALQEIGRYEQSVKSIYEQIMKKKGNIADMVNYMVYIFERMISHADSRSHLPFVVAVLHFAVDNQAIRFFYDKSQYTNPMDDYEFAVHNYRPLKNVAECEALAHALTQLTKAEMMRKYSSAACHIKLRHIDADVELKYEGANPNYKPPKTIV